MSRDIRSWFITNDSKKSVDASKPVKINKRRLILSSDDEESSAEKTKVKEKLVKSSVKKNEKKILSDSDDDSRHKKINKTKNSEKEIKKAPKPVNIESIFGKAPVKRVAALPVLKTLQKEEASVHDDDDFESTLNQSDINEIDAMYFDESKKNKTNGKRRKSHCEDDISPKKAKLTEKVDDKFEKVKNKNDKKEDEAKQPDGDKKLSNKSKATTSHEKRSKLDIVIEKNPIKKRKSSDDNDNGVDLFEERIAKKKQNLEAYQAYLHRGGARNPGSKPLPDGNKNCLASLSFVITGVMESLERDQMEELIEKYGGRVTKSISKKTDYFVVGEQAGESKLSKARSLNIKQISEDELLEMIKTRPAQSAHKILHSRSKKKEMVLLKSTNESSSSSSKQKTPEKSISKSEKISESTASTKNEPPVEKNAKTSAKEISTPPKSEVLQKSPIKNEDIAPKCDNVRVPYVGQAQALVEKYRPKLMKQIIGQHGDKSCAKKLFAWLQNWHKNHNGKVKQTKPSPWAKNDDGSFFKATLLSGPPGVGKTTTVEVVCKELGFDLLEFNASDTRSKRLLKEEISSLLSNTTVKGFYSTKTDVKMSSKPVLLMDEVDGMAGNEDRGGLQELISLIKSTEIPIICICNDRNNPKMRTLSNYTFDLRFQKPRIEQIRGAMKSLCCKENITITTENLDQLIQSTNQDIRQVINHLSMLVSGSSNKDNDQKNKNNINKDLKLGPWDVARKVFSAEEHKNMSIHDKSNLFFHDYSIAPLFVQENYLLAVPKCSKIELLERVAASAESLALGDLIDNSIRSNNSWSLLPVQACFSSVIPGFLMSGYISGQINFPAWLGRNSKRGKFDRLLQEITVHTRLTTGASKEAINIDYLKSIRDAILRPLVTNGTDGVETAVALMNHYHLLRDDLDALVEISLWPGQRDPMQLIETKVKAAFTRMYNKNAAPTPFAMGAASKKKGTIENQDSGFLDETLENDEQSEEDETLDSDRMVKAKKVGSSKPAALSHGSSNNKSAAKRGRGRERVK